MGDQIVTETIAWSWCLEEKARPCVRQKSEGPRWRLRQVSLLPGGLWVGWELGSH